jgi:hypothetical protein
VIDGNVAAVAFLAWIQLTSAGLGALIASRQPRNWTGWILLGASISLALNSLAINLAVQSQLAGPAFSSWTIWLAWFQNWQWPLFFPAGLTVLFLVLIPDGKLPGRRWRWLVWADLIYTPIMLAVAALNPYSGRLAPSLPPVGNPIGQPWLANEALQNGLIGKAVIGLGITLLVLTVGALIRRLVRSRGDERQQLKWIVYGTSTVIVVNVFGGVTGEP